MVFSPGREMEQFAREAGALVQDGPPRMDDVLALASGHGIEMTRPVEGIA